MKSPARHFAEDAINLRDLAVSSTVTACCPGSAGSFWSETTGWAGTEHRSQHV